MAEYNSIEETIAAANVRWPHLEFKRKTNREASSPCPLCGGKNRFLIWTDAGFWCRECEKKGWIDDDKPQELTPEEKTELRIIRLERQAKELARRVSALERMAQCTDHIQYHNNMTDRHKEWWYKQGIDDHAIVNYQLGYCPNPPLADFPSYTIPVKQGGQLLNIRHRLIGSPNGKYLPHMPGLGNQLFNVDLLENYTDIAVVEGAKKSIVIVQNGFPTVGIMGSRSFKREWLVWFKGKKVYMALDPDVDGHRLGRIFVGAGVDTRVCSFPVKPDDFFFKYGGTSDDFNHFLRLAGPVRKE